jgi:hypothetical protein
MSISPVSALFVGIIALTLTVNAESIRKPVPVLKIMALGDSITFGTGDGCNNSPRDHCHGGYRIGLWRNLSSLASQAEYNFRSVGTQASGPSSLSNREHEGHIGWTARMFTQDCGLAPGAKSSIDDPDIQEAWCLETYIKQFKPDIILMHLGTNSLARSKQWRDAVYDLKQLIVRIARIQPSAMYVLISP